MTLTPTVTSTPTNTPSGGQAILTFLVASASTQSAACALTPSFNVYAQDLGNCTGCFNCWPCITTSQQVFLDPALTIPVGDGYYKNMYNGGNAATWYIVGGFPQGGGFSGC